MKTTFLAITVAALGAFWIPQATRASSPPALDPAGNSLELQPARTAASAGLQPGPATVTGRNVNVRAKATTASEVILQMQDGEVVFVEEVILRTDATGKDPVRWAKIAYPTNATAWVHSKFVDGTSGTVKAKKLNVRSGPGENHAIVGTLQSGDTIKPVGTKGDWMRIEPPQGTTGYVAAKLLHQAAPPAAEVASTVKETVETQVVEDHPQAAAGTEATMPEMAPVEPGPAGVEGATGVTDSEAKHGTDLAPLPEVAPVLETIPEEPLPPRVVDREGIVRSFTSIQAPSHYKLVSPDNGKTINYIHTTSTNLPLHRYVGLHVIVTGEESLDSRWPNMPVLTLKRIVLVE